MAVTRSTSLERSEVRRGTRGAGRGFRWRTHELVALLAASVAVAFGLHLVYLAKSEGLSAIDSALTAKQLLNLNDVSAREDLLPALSQAFPQAAERDLAARKIYYTVGGLPNVGAVARIRVTADEVAHERGLVSFRARLGGRSSIPLLTGDQLRALKPLFVVRRAAAFRSSFYRWTALFFAGFLLASLWWSFRARGGDEWLLPAILALSGVGLILMVSLRDPVRDNLLFVDFAQGVLAGCVLMALAAELDYERLFGNLTFVPLLASFGLSALLILFGTGPGTSDAKVNLFGFQPVELIRILLVFFLAGYFAKRWDVLRHARETRASLEPLTSRFDIPPVEYTLPAVVCVALSLLFFFLQKDMGPALVFACLFLALYGMARGSAFVPLAGLALVCAGFLFGYYIGVPHTVGERVSMWLSPWNNLVHGGDQLADSLWAFATGGTTGMGIGKGDPLLVPAAHSDLILSALGEEWGFAGIAAVFALYAIVIWRALSIARRARTDYEFFLAAGMAAATVLQILLIAGGALGVLPLSGVVTPFLSYGRTALITNFLVIGILVGISGRAGKEATRFVLPVRIAGLLFAAAAALVMAKAAYVQVLRSSAVMGQGTLVVQADGARRYQYNPRFQEVMREIPMGTVYDRNGLPLATSDWAVLEKHRADFQQLGINIDQACPRGESRHYPFGGLTFDLLGDLRTRLRWAATNTSFVERDSARRLRGYDDRPSLVEVKNPKTGKLERVVRYDYRELVPLLRHRGDPKNAEVREVLDRPRDVHMSIDSRLQVRVSEILKKQLQDAHQDKGAAVVMSPASGDLLAAVSYPLPMLDPNAGEVSAPDQESNPYLDRARYGLYPPGSTFKVVTAMAALRKDAALTHKNLRMHPPARRARGKLRKRLSAAHSRRCAGHRPAWHRGHGARCGGLLQCLLRATRNL